jgi:hypothetical protein
MIAVDTNVLIYACDQSDPRKQTIALDLIAESTDGVLLWQVACEFLAASRKLSKQGFTATQAWNRLFEFKDLLPLVLPTAANLMYARELHIVLWRFAMGRSHSRGVPRRRRGRFLLRGCAGSGSLRDRARDQSVQVSGY